MREEWWERPVCFMCDYWWALLLAIVLALAAYFTRGYWMPAVSPPVISTPATPAFSGTPTETGTSTVTLITPSPSPQGFYGYTNASGGYAFNYPATWQGLESGTDAHFLLPDDAKVQISIRTASPEDTLQTLVADAGPLLLPQSRISDATVNGEAALKEDFLNAENGVTGRAYHVIHNGYTYFIALFSSPELPLPLSFSEMLAQFDQMVSSFYFLHP